MEQFDSSVDESSKVSEQQQKRRAAVSKLSNIGTLSLHYDSHSAMTDLQILIVKKRKTKQFTGIVTFTTMLYKGR